MRAHVNMMALALGALAASGCATPMAHPLRVQDGPWVEAGLDAVFETGRSGTCDNYQGCVDDDSDGLTGAIVHAAGGYGHVLGEHVGLMVGVWGPAWVNQKKNVLESPLALTGYATLQNEWASIGAGGDVGFGGAAAMAGLEVGDAGAWLGAYGIDFRVGVWGRRFVPWDERAHVEFNGQVGSWEAGARLTVGPIGFVQYAYYTQDSGVMDFLIYETSTYATTFHTVTLGISVNGFDAFDAIGRM